MPYDDVLVGEKYIINWEGKYRKAKVVEIDYWSEIVTFRLGTWLFGKLYTSSMSKFNHVYRMLPISTNPIFNPPTHFNTFTGKKIVDRHTTVIAPVLIDDFSLPEYDYVITIPDATGTSIPDDNDPVYNGFSGGDSAGGGASDQWSLPAYEPSSTDSCSSSSSSSDYSSSCDSSSSYDSGSSSFDSGSSSSDF